MDIEKEIKTMLRRNIMQEINGLGIRAAIREEIEASGINKGKIKTLVVKAIDSYVRSADVVSLVEKRVDYLVKNTVEETVKKYINGGAYSYNKPKELLEEQIKKQLFKEWWENYSLSVNVKRKE